MKKRTIIISTGLAIIGAISFVGCSQEENYMFDTDLSIDSQVPMTRSGGEQDFLTKKDYNIFSYGENECCLIALVELKQQTLHGQTYDADNSASAWYDKIKKYSQSLKDENGNQRYTGGAMELNMFLEVGHHFNLINERVHFSSDDERIEYFSNRKNDPKVINIDVYNEETGKKEPHVARVTSVDRKNGTVEYTTRDGYKTGEANISILEVKDVWTK